jgi:hypothetical protein
MLNAHPPRQLPGHQRAEMSHRSHRISQSPDCQRHIESSAYFTRSLRARQLEPGVRWSRTADLRRFFQPYHVRGRSDTGEQGVSKREGRCFAQFLVSQLCPAKRALPTLHLRADNIFLSSTKDRKQPHKPCSPFVRLLMRAAAGALYCHTRAGGGENLFAARKKAAPRPAGKTSPQAG